MPMIKGGDVIALGTRHVRVLHGSFGPLKDWRGRVAVRNVETDRLSYIHELRLLKAKSR